MLDDQCEEKSLTVGLSTARTCLLCTHRHRHIRTHVSTYTDTRSEFQRVVWLQSNDLLDDEVQSARVPQDHACLCNDLPMIVTPVAPTVQGALTL